MKGSSDFRGLAGEVVRGYLRPVTFLDAIPVLFISLAYTLAYLLVSFGLNYLFKQQPLILAYLNMLLALVAGSLFVGRYALGSSRGDIHAKFFGNGVNMGDGIAYAVRYGLLVISWSIPLSLVVFLIGKSMSIPGGSGGFGPMSGGMMGGGLGGNMMFTMMALGAFKACVLFLVFVASGLLSYLSFIIAAMVPTFSGVFSLDPWIWLFRVRGKDLPAFFTNFIGGLILHYVIYMIPMGIIVAVSLAIHAVFGGVVLVIILLMPLITSTVLMGRLVGVFIRGGDEEEFDFSEERFQKSVLVDPGAIIRQQSLDVSSGEAVSTSSFETLTSESGQPETGGVEQVVSEESSVELGESLKDLEERVFPDEESVLVKGKELLEKYPDSLVIARRVLLLYFDQNCLDAAMTVATPILSKLIESGEGEQAVEFFQRFGKERFRLPLNSQLLKKLHTPLLNQGFYRDAGWCIFAYEKKEGREDEAQRRLIETADQAVQAGKLQEGITLYKYYLKYYPEGSFADYATKALDFQKRHLHPES